MKKILIFLMAFFCVFSTVMAADVKPTILDPVANKRVVEISSQLRCLVCQNQSIADSNAELAMDLKNQVVKQIAAGKTNQQIIDFMVERYGDFVLYNPPFKLSTVLLWVGPAVFLVIALWALFWTLNKRRKLQAKPLTEEERKRADALLRGLDTGKTRKGASR
ncbi:MAG: cytochrome c-type biogenesis protein CcmH [Burkholderiales bacterium]|nr:cytochrome c-type biogenesis protein CcmH [Burkholderiales bacterium]